jgi:AcrR family transcriptional regulator
VTTTRAAEAAKAGGAAACADAGAASGRMAGDERRRQILAVAVRLFSQRGFRGTTTKEIAQSAGVSEAMVFRHFATKQELYAAILDHKACEGGLELPRELLSESLSRGDDRAVFTTLARRMMCQHEEDTDFLRLLMYAALEGHELAEMFWERTVRQAYDALGDYVRERQRAGAMRAVDPAVVVRAFVGMVIHHSLNNTLWDKRRTLLDIPNEQAAREFTEILLRGVAAEGTGHEQGQQQTQQQPPPRARRAAPATRGRKRKPAAGR